MNGILKYVQSVLLLFLFVLTAPNALSAAWEFIDADKEVIVFDWVQPGSSLSEEEKLFIKTFTEAYKKFTPADLGVEDKLLFLKDSFSDVIKDFIGDRAIILTAKKNGKVIGFASFNPTDKAHQMYVGQLAVDPDFWRKGIGKELVFGIRRLQPDVQKIVAIGRRLNSIGKNFFLKIGFTECAYMHPDYDAKKYVGYEFSF